jgi:hypothetical protein
MRSEAAWHQLLRVLEVMRPGLVAPETLASDESDE